MGHNLAEVGGVIPMFYADKITQDVWHKLGENMGAGMTARQVREWLDQNGNPRFAFPIEAKPLSYTWDGATRDSGMFALLRSDYGRQLGICTESYSIFDQGDGLDLAEAIADGRPFTTGGVLGGGRQTWLMLDNGEWFVGDERFKANLILTWGHDQILAVRLVESHTRGVCQNTINAAMENGRYFFSIKHDAKLEEKVKQIHEILKSLKRARLTLKERCDTLYGTPISEEYAKGLAERVARKVVPEPKDRAGSLLEAIADKADIMGAVLRATDADEATRSAREKREYRRADILGHILENTQQEMELAARDLSAWHLYNGATGWLDHQTRSRGEGRITSEMGGERAQLKNWIMDTVFEETTARAA